MRRDPPSQDSVVKVICICFSRLQSNIHCHTQKQQRLGGQSGSRARREQPPMRGSRQGIGFLSFSPFCRWRRQCGHASEGNGTRPKGMARAHTQRAFFIGAPIPTPARLLLIRLLTSATTFQRGRSQALIAGRTNTQSCSFHDRGNLLFLQDFNRFKILDSR